MNRSIISLATIAVFLVIGGSAYAGQISGITNFISGNTASSSDVNTNFDIVEAAVDDNDDRIISNASAITGKVAISGQTMTGTLSAPNLTYSSTKTRYLSVNPTAFRPRGNGYSFFISYYRLYPTVTGSSYEFIAPLSLPHGAVVTQADLFTYDNSSTGYIRFFLLRTGTTGSSSSMGSKNGSGTGIPGNETLTPVTYYYTTIDNYNYNYSLYANFASTDSSNTRLYGARITYTVSAPD